MLPGSVRGRALWHVAAVQTHPMHGPELTLRTLLDHLVGGLR
jgi:hypothetical protein